jgi:hypothetical protein
MNKPRCDGKLFSLPKEQRASLDSRLFNEDISYEDAVDWLFKEFGVVTSKSAIGRYYQQAAAALVEVNRIAESGKFSWKPRSDASLDDLSADAKSSLEKWLFDQNLGYDSARHKLQVEFAISTSRRAIASFYHRTLKARLGDEAFRRSHRRSCKAVACPICARV